MKNRNLTKRTAKKTPASFLWHLLMREKICWSPKEQKEARLKMEKARGELVFWLHMNHLR